MDKLLFLLILTYILRRNVYGESSQQPYIALNLNSIDSAVCGALTTTPTEVDLVKVNFYDFQKDIYITSRIGDAADIIANVPTFDYSRSFKIFIPGFSSNLQSNTALWTIDTMKKITNIYLIIIDYSAYTAQQLNKDTFEKALPYFSSIGDAVGKLIANLASRGLDVKKIHAIGHSSGAHIAGFMGQNFIALTGRKIARLTGLDPANPCFSDTLETQIHSGEADYVEVVHCDPGNLGTANNKGDVNFYFNRSSHVQCVRDWMHTISNTKLYQACESYEDCTDSGCVQGEAVTAGYHNNITVRGVYYACFNSEDAENF